MKLTLFSSSVQQFNLRDATLFLSHMSVADGNSIQTKMTAAQRLALEAALLDNCTSTSTDTANTADNAENTTVGDADASSTPATTRAIATDRARRTDAHAGVPTVYVDPNHDGHSTGAASQSKRTSKSSGGASPLRVTVRTVSEAVAIARATAPAGAHKRIVLSPGVHFLGWNGTMELGEADSGLTVTSGPEGQAWLSGGVPLGTDLAWKAGDNGVWSASLKGKLPPGATVDVLLRLEPHTRVERARYPNADTETAQWGYSSPLRSQ